MSATEITAVREFEIGKPDPLIVGPASAVFERGEQTNRQFPPL